MRKQVYSLRRINVVQRVRKLITPDVSVEDLARALFFQILPARWCDANRLVAGHPAQPEVFVDALHNASESSRLAYRQLGSMEGIEELLLQGWGPVLTLELGENLE